MVLMGIKLVAINVDVKLAKFYDAQIYEYFLLWLKFLFVDWLARSLVALLLYEQMDCCDSVSLYKVPLSPPPPFSRLSLLPSSTVTTNQIKLKFSFLTSRYLSYIY